MSRSPSPRIMKPDFRSLSFAIFPLVALAALVACGGGAASFHQRGGGGGNGAPCTQPPAITNSASTKLGITQPATPSTFMDLHVGSSDILNTVSIPYGSLRLWDT